MSYEEVLAAALADHGLRLNRTEIVDDATWSGCEQLLVYVQSEQKGVSDPIIPGDLDSRARIEQIAERVYARIRDRRAARSTHLARLPALHGRA